MEDLNDTKTYTSVLGRCNCTFSSIIINLMAGRTGHENKNQKVCSIPLQIEEIKLSFTEFFFASTISLVSRMDT